MRLLLQNVKGLTFWGHTVYKITAGNDYKKRILTYTRNHTQNYKHSAKLLHTADLMQLLLTSLCPASSIHSAVKMTLPAFAAERRCCWAPASAAVALLPAQSSAANPPNCGRTTGQTDGLTDTRPLHSASKSHTQTVRQH